MKALSTLRARAALAAAALAAGVTPAMAAVPLEVTNSLEEMKTDGVVVAGLVLVAIIAVAAIMFLKRAIR
jgi:hypothetical protein